MAEIKLTAAVAASPERVYEALTTNEGLTKWWTSHCSGGMEVDEKIRFEFPKYKYYCVMRIDNLEVGMLVAWTCIESNMGGTDEWVGTIIKWELIPKESGT